MADTLECKGFMLGHTKTERMYCNFSNVKIEISHTIRLNNGKFLQCD
uniref:Uncharacterized protein n=1 Tax=Rhizophora mucronata TaxID=61149 RepID=A0A2P2QK56_RHIMU